MLGVLAAPLLLANIAASRPDPATAGVEWSPGVRVLAEALEFHCVSVDDAPLCRFTATYELEPVKADPAPIAVRFVGTKAREVTLELDGQKVETTVTVRGPARLVARGMIEPGRFIEPSYGRSAMSVRHPVLGATVHRSHRFDFEYAIAPIRTWAGPRPQIALRIQHPKAWKVELSTDDGDLQTLPANEATLDGATVSELRVRMQVPPRQFFPGGPLAGVGWMSGFGPWVRVGYEVAWPSPIFYALLLESDLRRVLTLVPLASIASESLFGLIPSVSAGVGWPIDLFDGPVRTGFRGQLGLQWPFVGVVGGADLMIGPTIFVRGFVMLQVGL
jgi:hypothetical protein